jgi:CheY-like chemotaxis protein
VRDTGIGIAPAEQERIFREFEQADSGAARKFAGTGLGLTISRRIVERMDGRIGLDSTPGAGSTFEVTVALPPAANTDTSAVARPDLAGMNAMIIAPAAVGASLLARHLMHWGARTCVVTDQKGAAALLSEQAWDAIFIDYALGGAACEGLVRACTSATPRRLVLVTPAARHELPALKAAGFTGYLVKPVRAASLAARLGAADAGFDRAGDIASAVTERAGETVSRPGPLAVRGLAILVAEDNEINALLARALLVKLGHRPTLVPNGAAAVEAWLSARDAGEPYNLVLMDLHMPGSDGLEATRRIRAAESTSRHPRTPIIALTANAFEEDRSACIAAGMDDFLPKPLDRERLGAILASAIMAPLAA